MYVITIHQHYRWTDITGGQTRRPYNLYCVGLLVQTLNHAQSITDGQTER